MKSHFYSYFKNTISSTFSFLIFFLFISHSNQIQAQDTLGIEKINSNHPEAIYNKKRDDLRSKLNVLKQISFKLKNEKRDTFQYKVYHENGKFYYHYYPEARRIKEDIYNTNEIKGIDLKDPFSRKYEKGEWVTRDSTGKIVNRLRGIYFKDSLSYVYESFNEDTKKVTYRTFLQLDIKNNVISSAVLNGRWQNYVKHYYYNKDEYRSKIIKYHSDKLKPEIIEYNYYENGLLKSEKSNNELIEYEYQFRN